MSEIQETRENRDATLRTSVIEEINGALAHTEITQKRVNNAKAELGTATSEHKKAWFEYNRLRTKLGKLLPSVIEKSPEIPSVVAEA